MRGCGSGLVLEWSSSGVPCGVSRCEKVFKPVCTTFSIFLRAAGLRGAPAGFATCQSRGRDPSPVGQRTAASAAMPWFASRPRAAIAELWHCFKRLLMDVAIASLCSRCLCEACILSSQKQHLKAAVAVEVSSLRTLKLPMHSGCG